MTTLPALTRAQVRSVDKTAIEEYGIPGVVLMENAGSNAAKIIHQIVPEGPIEILCGGGNNAGDGYVIARHLQLMGREVQMSAQPRSPNSVATPTSTPWLLRDRKSV